MMSRPVPLEGGAVAGDRGPSRCELAASPPCSSEEGQERGTNHLVSSVSLSRTLSSLFPAPLTDPALARDLLLSVVRRVSLRRLVLYLVGEGRSPRCISARSSPSCSSCTCSLACSIPLLGVRLLERLTRLLVIPAQRRQVSLSAWSWWGSSSSASLPPFRTPSLPRTR